MSQPGRSDFGNMTLDEFKSALEKADWDYTYIDNFAQWKPWSEWFTTLHRFINGTGASKAHIAIYSAIRDARKT